MTDDQKAPQDTKPEAAHALGSGSLPPTSPELHLEQPIALLPEHASAPRLSLQYLSGAAALVLVFFASASLTVAYLSGTNPVSAASQTAGAAIPAKEDPFSTVSLIAQSAYVLDLATGKVLYSKNSDAQLPLASLIKVPLVLTVLEALPPDHIITIPPHTTPDGAAVRLPAGLQFSTQELINFTLVASSNEGAEILSTAAERAMLSKYPQATPDKAVLWRMNDIAKGLGLVHMFFLNTNGLDMSDTQAGAYGSARDVAVLFGHAASTAPEIFGQTSRDTLKIRAATGETVTAANTDEALPAIPGIIMGKTGYTSLAGGNLAVVFEAGPAHPIVAVVLHSSQNGRFEDIKKLVEAAVASIGFTR
ncbi:D-alanyl-D-alanine carboxypeptidase [Candidatus Kaiserbacteria bacterium]|nr:D-alanyl-D-alanine carboxypeptidase [Candidatus Kaiserbacteria bacterium]